MFKKITQKKLSKSFALTACCLFTNILFAQTTIVDFEVPSEFQHLAWEGTAEVVANPNSSGINTSTNVGKYTTPANKAWGNASVVIINSAIALKDLDHMDFSAIVPSSTQMYAKLENTSSNSGIAEAWATPTTSVNWQSIILNFSALGGVDVNTATYDKLTFFFNVNDNVGGEIWYFDDITITDNVLSIDNEKKTNDLLNVYPNPVNDLLSISGNFGVLNDLSVEIYDTTGRLIKSANDAQIIVEELNAGIYIVKINLVNGEVVTRKFVKS
jgi:hypothetical protein